MSIIAKDCFPCMELQNIRIKDGAMFNLDDFVRAIKLSCDENGVDVIVDKDTVVSGRLFDKSTVECITIRNPEHLMDYDIYVMNLQKQGKFAFVTFNYVPQSRNRRLTNTADNADLDENLIGGVFSKIKKAVLVKDDAVSAENMYYSIVETALSEMGDYLGVEA